MSSVVDTLFGGVDKSSLKQQKKANEASQAFIRQMGEQARSDALALGPAAFQNRNLGAQAGLDVLGQTIPQQFGTFQQGNMGAQAALLGGLPQIQNAIMGMPVDYSAFQPQAINYDTSWAQQQLPQFVGPGQALGGTGAPDGSAGMSGTSGTPGMPGGRFDLSRFLTGQYRP